MKNIGCNNRSCCQESDDEVRRGPWTSEEDNLLVQYVGFNGAGHWNSLAKYSGLRRTGKSCRLRWMNYLKPDIKRGNLSPHEQLLILELHARWGNRWSKIAKNLPGRTDNEIKNYWRTRVQKQARQLKLDSNSHKFLEAVRMLWKPRLLEKIEQDSSFTSSPSLPYRQGLPCPNSDNLVKNSGSNSSGEMIIRQPDEISGNLFTGNFPFQDDYCCHGGILNYYDVQELGSSSQDVVLSERHVAWADWLEEETVWDTDDLWQFRKA